MNTVLPSSKPRPRWRRLTLWIITSVVVAGVLCIGVFAVGIYVGGWQGAKTQRILQVVPLPAAYIGWRPLPYANYLDQRRAIEQSTAYLAASSGGAYQVPADQDSGQISLTKMIRLAESEELMKRFGITVTDAEVSQALQSQVFQNNNPDVVRESIRRLYGWSESEFATNVIRPVLILDALQEKLSFDDTLNASARQQAEQVLARVKEGTESFEALAKKYSDDVYGASGGDLGFIKLGEQAKEIDEAIDALAEKQTSDLIHTKYGFHVVQRLESKTVEGQEQIHVRQITILAPQVDTYLNEALKQRTIRILAAGYRWDQQQVKVVRDSSAASAPQNTTQPVNQATPTNNP